MHRAPPVRVDIPSDPCWRGLTAVLGALAGAALAAWAAQWWALASMSVALAAGVGLMIGAIVAWRLLGIDQGMLQWDGAVWRWQTAGSSEALEGDAAVVVDAGPWLLLRFDATRPARARAWLALSRHAAGPAWSALRTAVYSRRPETDSAPRT